MTENSPATIDRRRFLAATAATTALLGGVSSAGAQSQTDRQISIEQDGKCIPITPLRYDGLPVEEFYDYRTPDTNPPAYEYASFGTEMLQRENTSILFLYEGPNGLSLVMVHDKVNSQSNGGAASFRLTGLNVDGEWVIKDDSYDGSTNHDTFDHSKHRNWNGEESASSVIHWTWRDGRADGAAYRPMGDDFEVKVHPSFNEQALLSNQGGEYRGDIEKWEVLSGDVSNPTRTKLDMTKNITIRSESCQSGTTTAGNTTTSGGSTKPNDSGQKSFFDKIGDGIASALNAVVSFFTNLF